MTSKERVLRREYERGRLAACTLQQNAHTMEGTELNEAADRIPRFCAAVKRKNMLERKAGLADGFVCKSSAGRVVRLIQNYDSDIFTQEPELLPAQFAFVWSCDPSHALPFLSLSTSPYMTGNFCTEKGNIYRAKRDGNIHPPSVDPSGWEVWESR